MTIDLKVLKERPAPWRVEVFDVEREGVWGTEVWIFDADDVSVGKVEMGVEAAKALVAGFNIAARVLPLHELDVIMRGEGERQH